MRHPIIRDLVIPNLCIKMKKKGTFCIRIHDDYYDEAIIAIETVAEKFNLKEVAELSPELENCFSVHLEPLGDKGNWIARITVQ